MELEATLSEQIEKDWEQLLDQLKDLLQKKPDLNGVLFLIGIQELGQGLRNFSKEEKQDLMHLGICKALSSSGYYELEGIDNDGWPHYRLIQKLPFLDLKDQEVVLKMHVIEYFRNEVFPTQ